MNSQSVNQESVLGIDRLSGVRIVKVNIHILEAALSRRFGWSLGWTGTRSATVVEVITDEGVTGWGDGNWGGSRLLENPELVIGRSPFEVEAIFDDLRPPAGHQTRVGEPSAGGLDVALWDLCGKLLGRPVCDLLGRRHRSRIEPYLTALYRLDWPDLEEGLVEEALGWKNQGWRSMKMKIGYGPDTDVRAVRAVRRAIGDSVGLGVDSNCAYDAGTALSLGRRLEEFNPFWWEEPLLATDLPGYKRLAESLRIPIASGETLSTDRLILDFIQPRLVDIIQPDLDTVGLTGGRRLSYLCWLNHLRLVPHNWGTAIRTAATLHWMAATPPQTEGLHAPPVTFEFDQTESPFRDAVIRERIAPDPSDGMIAVPCGPGLGVEVLPEALKQYRKSLIQVG
ncbi:MAG: mandelate racemase/muconate lactonizing enzyme family protein [Acidobacteria bacterium]|nr:mandelate racemase/muconate lactonizing enzyme family protein [Acidobacteriota bacterium]